MKKYYVASLCLGGILGGGLKADDAAVTYHTGKVTVSPRFRHLEMKYSDLRGFSRERWGFIPTVVLSLEQGDSFRFIVFGRKGFCAWLRDHGVPEMEN